VRVGLLGGATMVDPNTGVFEFAAVPPGSYYLIAQTQGPAQQRMSARLPLDVGNGDITGVPVRLTPPLVLNGSITVEGTQPAINYGSLRLNFVPAQQGQNGQAQVKADTTFQAQLDADSYTLEVNGLPDGYYLKTVKLSGREIPDAALDLVIEIPHGATTTADFTALAAQLTSPLPDGLIDFFHVNTDAGAPELALATARRLVADQPTRAVAVVRCRIPRTFIDCNRRIDASPDEFRAGKVTPGVMPWITTAEDRARLRGAYDRYVAAVRDAAAALGPTGALLLLHSYAPRSVDVEVDLQIVPSLRRAYQPDREPTWPLRPEVDVIGRALDGTDHAPPAVVGALRGELAGLGIAVADSATYPLHPSTLAWDHVVRRPGRTLCLEVRRDLLADPFDPFVEMTIGAAKVARLVGPFVRAIQRWW